MTEEIKLEILSSGHIKFKRGDIAYNNKMRKIISSIIGDDDDQMAKVNKFFNGSEDVELLIGDNILCG
jgi:hypothetical protein